ncbi:MAG: DUF3540 domain-containing protein [Polyangiaceae bacterium]
MTVTALFTEAPTDLSERARRAVSVGPAVITRATPGALAAQRAGAREVDAALAVAFTYEPAVGDEVLLIEDGEGKAWVIGVLRSTGRGVVSFPGDLSVRAENGKLTLSGDRGVAIESPDVEIRASKLRTFAGAVLQHVESLSQRVRELYTLHAGNAQTIVEETALTQARRAKIVTEENVSINGREIHLG